LFSSLTLVTENGNEIGLSGVAGVLPPRQHDLQELAAAGLLRSSPKALSAFGFERAHICDRNYPLEDMALDAARTALSDARLEPRDVDVLVWASARPESHVRSRSVSEKPEHAPRRPASPAEYGFNPKKSARVARLPGARPRLLGRAPGARAGRATGGDVMQGFRYTSAWLQNALGLHNADVMAVAQQGCSTMFAALRVARSLLLAEPGRQHALCVGADVLPDGAPREILYNVISDAACAVVVSRGCREEKWLGFTQLSRGYYCDPAACGPEIVAAYFPTAKAVIEHLLVEHGLQPDDIDVVVPTGVNRASWDILLRLVGISADRLHCGLPSFGHTITADSFLHLQDLRRRGQVPRGSRLLLFTYGFGSSWCGLLLEH
jgi:3-oxoacyl-[acyl-carrier-protein] synthase-3